MAKVLTRDNRGNFGRLAFDGTESDARQYIINNFPRLHIEPGMNVEPEADAVLSVDGADDDFWNGDVWYSEKSNDDSDDIRPDDSIDTI